MTALAGDSFRWAALSVVSLALGYVLTTLFKKMVGLQTEHAYGFAIVLCSIVNFFGCRYYVFRGLKAPMWLEALKFFPSVLAFRTVEILLFSFLNRLVANYHIAYFVTAGTSMAFKLLVSRLFIFRRD